MRRQSMQKYQGISILFFSRQSKARLVFLTSKQSKAKTSCDSEMADKTVVQERENQCKAEIKETSSAQCPVGPKGRRPHAPRGPTVPLQTYGALDHTAKLLAKLRSGFEDPDVSALSEDVKAKLGIAGPLPKPELSSPSPGLSTLADDLKRSRVSRVLPKVTCPSPFHPRARTVPMAELLDGSITETEKRGLSALALLAGVSPSGLTPGDGKTGRPIAQANIQLELPEFDPKNVPEWAEEFAEFLLLTGQSHVDVATKCSLLKRSCKKKFLQK